MRSVVTALCTGLLLAVPAAAQAGPLSGLTGCPGDTTTQPFKRWADPAHYVQVPDGGLERGGVGWTFAGGAAVVAGNETFAISGPGARSLRLPAGGSAVTPLTCVGVGSPTLRFISRGSGALPLRVAVRINGAGAWLPVAVGALPSASWAPTLPLPFVVNATAALNKSGTTKVQFRFTAPAGGTWSVDDVFVDPYKWR